MWRDFMTFDNWEYGGLDDDSKQSKAFVADYNMKTDMDKLHEVNNGFCLSGWKDSHLIPEDLYAIIML